MTNQRINVVIIDQHQLFREGLKKVLQTEEKIEILASSDDFSVVIPMLSSEKIDVLLLDIHIFMKHKEIIKQSIVTYTPHLKVVIMSTEGEENFVTEAIQVGVDGYILKEMDVFSFIDAILSVAEGNSFIHPVITNDLVLEYRKLSSELGGDEKPKVERPLHLYTKRECEVLQLLASGHSNRSMAKELNISEKTVKNHVSSLFKKMKVNDRTQAVVTAIKNHWVEI